MSASRNQMTIKLTINELTIDQEMNLRVSLYISVRLTPCVIHPAPALLSFESAEQFVGDLQCDNR